MKSAANIINDLSDGEVRDFAIAALIELQQVRVTTCEDILKIIIIE